MRNPPDQKRGVVASTNIGCVQFNSLKTKVSKCFRPALQEVKGQTDGAVDVGTFSCINNRLLSRQQLQRQRDSLAIGRIFTRSGLRATAFNGPSQHDEELL